MSAGMAALLAPRLLAARNVARRSPARPVLTAVLTLLFWAGCFWAFLRALDYFQALAEFGPLLTQRLLGLLFLSLGAVLLVSNTVTALGTFYLADDVAPLLAAPVPARRLHHARFAETLLSSSWMVLVVGLPALAAYGVVHGAGVGYYLGVLAVLVPFLVIPAAAGVLLTTALVFLFPARGVRDALLVGTGLLLGGLVLGVRLLDPERLAHPSGLVGFAGFLADLGASGSPWLPSTWAAEVLLPLLGTRDGDVPFHLGLLASTAVMLFLVSAWLVETVFLRAWTHAQTGRQRGIGAPRPLARWLARLVRPLPRVPGLLFAKDATIFLRDATQWSQLLLVGALVAIYLYNFSALPLDDDSPLALAMRDLAALLNLGLGAFVTTAVAVRFVYPMPSLEGRAWWIVRTAPVALTRVWWAKFAMGALPLLALSAALVLATNAMLGVPGIVTAVFLASLVPLVAAEVALGLWLGARHARLDSHNAAQIATSAGAIVYMLLSLGLIALVVAVEAWPVATMLRRAHAGLPDAPGLAALAVGLGWMASAPVFFVARRAGLRAWVRLAE
jgi:ABC-2 type transport system permease protein